MKRLFASAVVAAIAAVGISLATTASAGAAPPVGGCPSDDWILFSVSAVLPGVDVGNFHDQNGDGFACWHFNKGLTPKVRPTYAWTIKDNTNPKPSDVGEPPHAP